MKWIIQLAVVVALPLLCLVRPLRAEDQTADQRAARDAIVHCLSALAAGDGTTLKALSYNYDSDVLQAFADNAAAGVKYQEAVKRKFPDVPPRQDAATAFAKIMESAEIHVNGNSALASGSSPKDRVFLKRVDGQWKVDVTPFMPKLPPNFDKPTVLHNLEALKQTTEDFTRDLPGSSYPDFKTADAALKSKYKAVTDAAAAGGKRPAHRDDQVAPGNAPTDSTTGSDVTGAADAASRCLVAMAMGDAAEMKLLIETTHPEIVEAMADAASANRKLDAAARAKFNVSTGNSPFSSLTQEQIAAKFKAMSGNIKVNGDDAEAYLGASRPPMKLHRTSGTWRVVGASIFPSQTDDQNEAATIKAKIVSSVHSDVADEISHGKYASWPAAHAALERKTAAALAASKEYQSALRAVAVEQPAEAGSSDPSKDSGNLPAGASSTEVVGGTGGKPFVNVDPSAGPLVGFQYSFGHWGGKQVLQTFDPVYAGASSPSNKEFKTIVARDGYQVAGLFVSGDGTNAVAVRVLFARATDGHPDMTKTYQSDWIGIALKVAQRKLGGDGRIVIGTSGRKGKNLDALGLVLLPASAHAATAPAR